MPQFTIEDSQTGRQMTVEGEQPPSPQDIAELFAGQQQQIENPMSKGESAAIGAASAAAPTAGAWAGITAMEALTAPLVAGTAEIPPLAGGIALASGLVGAIGGASAADWIQQKLLPDSIKEKIAKAHEDNKWSFNVGSMVFGALAFKIQPGLVS